MACLSERPTVVDGLVWVDLPVNTSQCPLAASLSRSDRDYCSGQAASRTH